MDNGELNHHLQRLILKKAGYWDIWDELNCRQRKIIRGTLNYQGLTFGVIGVRAFRHLLKAWKIEKVIKTMAEELEVK